LDSSIKTHYVRCDSVYILGKSSLLIISELRALELCLKLRIISRRWILFQGNRGRKSQSVSNIRKSLQESGENDIKM